LRLNLGFAMKVLHTELAGVLVVETVPVVDQRGTFARWFCENELGEIMKHRRIAQINYSRTTRLGAVRGFHYQHAPHAEMKLIRCLKGRVFDVAVDLRQGSPTMLRWHAEELTPASCRMLVIPEGCAHGFQAMEAESDLLYLHTASYVPEAEGGVRFDEDRIGVAWPLPVVDLSLRDHSFPVLATGFSGIFV
jgi:dTDP-4-dehydrorhamnose 3,5-epimerase